MSLRPTIVVVDDAPEVRAVLRTSFRLSGKLDVVGEGADGAAAVELAGLHRPSLMLLDVSMPVMDGLEALPHVRKASPETRVVMYSGFDEDGLATRTAQLGAAAFIQKAGSLDALLADLLAIADPAQPDPGPSDIDDVDPPAAESTEAEIILKEHLERFGEVFADAAIGMGTLTLSGRLVRANHQLAQLLGVSGHLLVGTAYGELTGGHDSAVDVALDRVLRQSEDVAQVEHGVTGADDGRRLLATLSPVRDSRHRPLYVFLQVQDVTRQRGAEQDLRHILTRFRLLVDAVEDYAIFMLDPAGYITTWNAGAQRSKGYTAEEIIGQHFRIFYPAELQAEHHPEHELERALEAGHYEEEGWRIRKDGTRFWATVTITAVHDEDGAHIGFAKVTRDTTAHHLQRQAQDRAASTLAAAYVQINTANDNLARTAEDQAKLLSMTAHELRSPVGVLAMSAELLKQRWAEIADEERDRVLDGMSESATRLQRLLADLLTVSGLQASALVLQPAVLDVREVLEFPVGAVRQTVPEPGIEVDVDSGLRVLADRERLSQIVEHLLLNATRHGAPPVRIQAVAAGDSVRIIVRDSGPGVPAEVRRRLFERFVTGRPGGTGLGLHIVRELARAQGGDASYDADDNAFVITLPLAPEEPDGAAPSVDANV
jgi:PAS domain S-box-containing protein